MIEAETTGATRARDRPARWIVFLATVAGLLSIATVQPAGAAVQLGETFTPSTGTGGGVTVLQSGSPGGEYAAPSAGVLTSWSFQAPAANVPTLKFKVARPAGGNDFTTVGEEGPRTFIPGALNTFPARISVQPGDVIGYFVTADPGGGFARVTNAHPRHVTAGDQPVGTTKTYGALGNAIQLDLSATLEPDCDRDGFGDETQESSVDCAAPETTLTEQPKNKTGDRRAKFAFTSSEQGSSFKCAVDGQALKVPCTSPYKVKVKKGKHTFQVQATDPSGNTDATPATDDWKVKEKG